MRGAAGRLRVSASGPASGCVTRCGGVVGRVDQEMRGHSSYINHCTYTFDGTAPPPPPARAACLGAPGRVTWPSGAAHGRRAAELREHVWRRGRRRLRSRPCTSCAGSRPGPARPGSCARLGAAGRRALGGWLCRLLLHRRWAAGPAPGCAAGPARQGHGASSGGGGGRDWACGGGGGAGWRASLGLCRRAPAPTRPDMPGGGGGWGGGPGCGSGVRARMAW